MLKMVKKSSSNLGEVPYKVVLQHGSVLRGRDSGSSTILLEERNETRSIKYREA